jgi:hypothetical protein
MIGYLIVIILNYYFDDFITFLSLNLKRLDAFNITHGYKQSAECSSSELRKTTSTSKPMSKDELERQVLLENSMGCCLVGFVFCFIVYFFFE